MSYDIPRRREYSRIQYYILTGLLLTACSEADRKPPTEIPATPTPIEVIVFPPTSEAAVVTREATKTVVFEPAALVDNKDGTYTLTIKTNRSSGTLKAVFFTYGNEFGTELGQLGAPAFNDIDGPVINANELEDGLYYINVYYLEPGETDWANAVVYTIQIEIKGGVLTIR